MKATITKKATITTMAHWPQNRLTKAMKPQCPTRAAEKHKGNIETINKNTTKVSIRRPMATLQGN
jgi:hypothetical protein